MNFKSILKVINSFITIILFIVLVFLLFIVISSRASHGEPAILGYELKSVLSGSMDPTFKTGSVIAVKPVEDTTHFKKGDIITFQSDLDYPITHRIYQVKKDGQEYITKGDHNNAPDVNPVQADQVIGTYNGFTIPYLGYLIHFASSKNTITFVLFIAGFFFIGYSIFTFIRAFRGMETVEKDKKSHKVNTN